MPTWMKFTAGFLLIALLGMLALVIQDASRETVVFVFPDPDVSGVDRQFTCFEPYRNRSAQENADLAYDLLVQFRQSSRQSDAPDIQDFREVAAQALSNAEAMLAYSESEYGCIQELTRQ